MPWCYTMDRDTEWDYCFEDCATIDPCVAPDASCAFYGSACSGSSLYNDLKSTTISGRTCQRWDVQSPHAHSQTPRHDFEENYCITSKGKDAPWCYTTDSAVEWEYCFIDCASITTSAIQTTKLLTTKPASITTSAIQTTKLLTTKPASITTSAIQTTKLLTTKPDENCSRFRVKSVTISNSAVELSQMTVGSLEECGEACIDTTGCGSIQFHAFSSLCVLASGDPTSNPADFGGPPLAQVKVYSRHPLA